VPKEDELTAAFVAFADTIAEEFDLDAHVRMMTERCAAVLEGETACLLRWRPEGELELAAACGDRMRSLELLQLRHMEGPAVDAYRSGRGVYSPHLRTSTGRWPRFAPAALAAGFQSALALPLWRHGEGLGVLDVLSDQPADPDGDRARIGQALADVAASGLFYQRTLRRQEVLVEQLQTALTSRILIEQAKGVLAERAQISIDDAFATLRDYARSHRRKLKDVAEAVVAGSPDVADLDVR
jgi:hypothetical protein